MCIIIVVGIIVRRGIVGITVIRTDGIPIGNGVTAFFEIGGCGNGNKRIKPQVDGRLRPVQGNFDGWCGILLRSVYPGYADFGFRRFRQGFLYAYVVRRLGINRCLEPYFFGCVFRGLVAGFAARLDEENCDADDENSFHDCII